MNYLLIFTAICVSRARAGSARLANALDFAGLAHLYTCRLTTTLHPTVNGERCSQEHTTQRWIHYTYHVINPAGFHIRDSRKYFT